MTTQEAIEEMRAMLKTANKMGVVFQGRPDINRRKEAYAMAIQALRKESAYEQMKWERDVAISQLEEIGLGLGEKTDKVKFAVETAKKIPKVIEKLEEQLDKCHSEMKELENQNDMYSSNIFDECHYQAIAYNEAIKIIKERLVDLK